ECKERYLQYALNIYLTEQVKPGNTKKGAGLRASITQAEEACLQEEGVSIKLDKQTLLRRSQGGRSIRDLHADQTKLAPEEVNMIIEYA
ncbi:hypothetical protein FISHEDRAFT_8156, partial [Fistulina hepatica ATCC 64428]